MKQDREDMTERQTRLSGMLLWQAAMSVGCLPINTSVVSYAHSLLTDIIAGMRPCHVNTDLSTTLHRTIFLQEALLINIFNMHFSISSTAFLCFFKTELIWLMSNQDCSISFNFF